jgi:hypothetical protein
VDLRAGRGDDGANAHQHHQHAPAWKAHRSVLLGSCGGGRLDSGGTGRRSPPGRSVASRRSGVTPGLIRSLCVTILVRRLELHDDLGRMMQSTIYPSLPNRSPHRRRGLTVRHCWSTSGDGCPRLAQFGCFDRVATSVRIPLAAMVASNRSPNYSPIARSGNWRTMLDREIGGWGPARTPLDQFGAVA